MKCQSCRYWERLTKPDWADERPLAGTCYHPDLKIWSNGAGESLMHTLPDFGCVQFDQAPAPKVHKIVISDAIGFDAN